MQIRKVKHFVKVRNGEEEPHVIIEYTEGNKEVVLHGTTKAKPEFYKLFKELSEHVCRICEFSDHEVDRTHVSGASISYRESDEGDDVMCVVFTARRTIVASPQDLIFNTPVKFSEHNDPGQKLSSDCFAVVEALTAEAEDYIDGKRDLSGGVQEDAFEQAQEASEDDELEPEKVEEDN